MTANGAYFEDHDGIKYNYHFSEFGAVGNIDSGGNDERVTREKLLEFLPPNSVFYDIGAHEGLFTLYAMRKRPNVRTVSFEPLPEHLIENLKLNRFSADFVQPVAVGASNGTASITTDARSSNHVTANGKGREVPVIALDDYIALHELPLPTAIKIDIEGMEPAAMSGAQKILMQFKPIVICEINHCFHRFQNDLRPFVLQMAGLGYSFYKLTEKGEFEPIVDAPKRATDLPSSADYNYWFIPKDKSP